MHSPMLTIGSLSGEDVHWEPFKDGSLLLVGAAGQGKSVILDSLARSGSASGLKVYYFLSHDFSSPSAGFEDFYRIMLSEVEARPETQFLVLLDGGETLITHTGGMDASNTILTSLQDEDLGNLRVAMTMQTPVLLQEPFFPSRCVAGAHPDAKLSLLDSLAEPQEALAAAADLTTPMEMRFGAVLETFRGDAYSYRAFLASLR